MYIITTVCNIGGYLYIGVYETKKLVIFLFNLLGLKECSIDLESTLEDRREHIVSKILYMLKLGECIVYRVECAGDPREVIDFVQAD